MSINDDLPHLDPPPTTAELEAARALVSAELDPSETGLHPQLLNNFPGSSSTTPAAESFHASIAANNGKVPPSKAIDTSRYEAPTAPESSDREVWKSTLRRAYASSAYLNGRAENLKALEENGKNAWLVANFEVEEQLRALVKDLKEAKSESLGVDEERRVRQEGVRGEMDGLNEGWKAALNRAVEAEIAGINLKREIEDARAKRGGG